MKMQLKSLIGLIVLYYIPKTGSGQSTDPEAGANNSDVIPALITQDFGGMQNMTLFPNSHGVRVLGRWSVPHKDLAGERRTPYWDFIGNAEGATIDPVILKSADKAGAVIMNLGEMALPPEEEEEEEHNEGGTGNEGGAPLEPTTGGTTETGNENNIDGTNSGAPAGNETGTTEPAKDETGAPAEEPAAQPSETGATTEPEEEAEQKEEQTSHE